jgi:hypothetical protein
MYTTYNYQNHGTVIGRNFNSLQAFIETAKGGQKFKRPLDNDPDFFGRYGLTSWEVVIDEFNKWQDTEMALVNSLIAKLESKIAAPEKRRRRAAWKQEGDSFSFERAFDRKEKCWAGSRKVNRSAPRSIDIVFEFGAMASVSASELLNKPAVAIALCDLLEQAGYIVRLIGHRRADRAWKIGTEEVASVENIILKDEGQPLDKVSVVNAMSGWFYRTLCFAARTNLPSDQCVTGYCGSMGFTRTITNDDTEHVVDNLDSAIIIKGSFNLEQITREAIARLVEMGIMTEAE